MGKYEKKFALTVLSMDWHLPNHCSFHSNNVERDPSAKLFAPCKLESGAMQVMWPDHCVQGSNGSKIHKDAYSAFMDNDKKTKTALNGLLKEAEITEIVCVGLAYDYCVGNTALDGVALGYKAYIVKDASASVAKESEEEIEKKFAEQKVNVVKVEDLEELLK